MAAIVILLWIGSLVAGWHHFYIWLIVPVGFFVIHVLQGQRQALAALKRNGMSGEFYRKQMIIPNLRLILWSALQHGFLFLVGGFLSRLT
ncbi:hypothetical protein [Novosphingobium lentum]|uniref:hypothetical protein n=1 Tax=Novosphingobium lentum TaxID=145287 RepID=UPI00082BC01C|nr:hypothetical protein [Novosphingobium lentum]